MGDITLSMAGIPAGSRVLCAVSGGADSVCLLHRLLRAPGIECICAHFDHGIRGAESRRDAQFVRALCEKWNVTFVLGEGDVPAYAAAHGLGIEEAARIMRYDFLRRTAKAQGADVIATAHNKNDNAETVLLALARGTGLRGLGGIPPVREGIVRPLLGVSRREIEEYLTERGIEWAEDSTNASDECARNRARHHVLPALETLHTGALDNISRMTETLREDEEFLSALAADFLARQEGETLSAAALAALPKSVARRVLRQWLGGELSRERTEAILALCRSEKPSAAAELPGGITVRREYDKLLRTEESESAPEARELAVGERVIWGNWELECSSAAADEEIQSSFNTFSFSYDKICGKLFVTSRMSGDTILLRGRPGTRSLKKLMIDAKIPAARRACVPVLRDEAGVLAVYGFGQAERAFPTEKENVFRIKIREI